MPLNEHCKLAVAQADGDFYFRENETFHAIIYKQSGNRFLETESLQLQNGLHPFRRMQLRLRGRMAQSMRESKAILSAHEAGDGHITSAEIRTYIAVQGEKFHHLVASLKSAAEQN